MNKERYDYLCMESEAGRDTFVMHPATLEEGLVKSCLPPLNHIIVRTSAGVIRTWDYHECEELCQMLKDWPRH